MYTIGQRVKYTSPLDSYAFHCASMGNQAAVMHLNARDEKGRIRPITGTVTSIPLPGIDGTIYYDFTPDGWILPPSGWPRGFQVGEKDISPAADDEYLPGTITDSLGKPLQ